MRTRKLWILLLAVVCLLALSVTAFAKVDGDSGVIETWAQITEPPPDTAPATPAAPAKPDTSENPEPDSGGFYTRDLLYDADTHKQFITVQGRDGNLFYIVIDYDVAVGEGEEQYKVYFLNQVDESDLAALVGDSGAAAPPACSCGEKCAVGAVNTACPVCAVNMAVGSGQGWTPIADMTDIAAVREHLPKPDKSLITAIFFVIGLIPSLKDKHIVTLKWMC